MTTDPFLRRIRAVSAGRGLQWFPDARMQGNCRDFGPGRYNDLGPLGGKVSSAAIVAGNARTPSRRFTDRSSLLGAAAAVARRGASIAAENPLSVGFTRFAPYRSTGQT